MRDRTSLLVFAYHTMGYECLDVLIKRGEYIVAVITHRDDPAEEAWFKSVAALAKAHAIPVFTPDSVNTPVWASQVRTMAPDILLSFSYRNMIREEILQIPRLGSFNMHCSLLPEYRGRAPITWAVLQGARETGATLHRMERHDDTGDIVDQQAVPIGPDDTAFEVYQKVTLAARDILERQIEAIKTGTAPRVHQDESKATHFLEWKPENGRIDWTHSAESIYNLIRGATHPYPGAFTEVNGMRFYIWRAKRLQEFSGTPGQVVAIAPLRVTAGKGALEIIKYQWEGTPEQHAASGNHGLRIGQVLAPLSR
jgi:methionyl-tRNA formyltransferase